ncbi:MAG: polysaccharide biosynthesis protein, partial [Lachnospiraceae bacterium]|nr:polysaccharide biosynthesis protein [Lachnospiraceae bacterium]
YLPLIQGAVNLVVSILLVQRIGVTGVYVGTLVSGILANLIRPGIIYRMCFERKAWVYFRDSLKYIVVILAVGIVVLPIKHMVMKETTILTFAVMVVIITLLYNVIFLAVFHRTEEFAYLWKVLAARVPVLKRISEGRSR